ncbi:uncharacterized protein METZ01_LOCUS325186 [marine metagenome]|uniref:Uncharacterized protein n=1 Tax=marine metagenome TaxID=408172 RepID=A0A382PK37_9ZZZZ|tara:strand:+ start:446 stop:667 length:222 start_codon:yes stop_codon:yes gene_type:complete
MTIEEGLGSMSAMLVIISIITIGAIMAVRNKTRGKIVKDAIEPEPKSEPEPVTDTTTDIDDKLDQLKRDVQDE